METIIDRMRKILQESGKRQADLARMIGISTASVTNLLNGRNKPSSQTITSICREFGVSEKWLRTGEGEMYADKANEELIKSVVQKAMAGRSKDIQYRMLRALDCQDDRFWQAIEQLLIAYKAQIIEEYEEQRTKE